MSINPKDSAIASESYAGPAVFLCKPAATATAVPTKTSRYVPISSARAVSAMFFPIEETEPCNSRPRILSSMAVVIE